MKRLTIHLLLLLVVGCGESEPAEKQPTAEKQNNVAIESPENKTFEKKPSGEVDGVPDNPVRIAESYLQTLVDALELYHVDMDSYPEPDSGLYALLERPNILFSEQWRGPYLAKDLSQDPWDQEYYYEIGFDVNDQLFYEIWSAGPNGKNEYAEDGTDDIVVRRISSP